MTQIVQHGAPAADGPFARVFHMTQGRIDGFADCTEDQQWIHIDPERASQESPTGGTIAHGYLTLALLAAAHEAAGVFPERARRILNYGLDKVRFLAPVPSGSKLRFQIELISEEPRKGNLLLRTSATGYLIGDTHPVILAESLYLADTAPELETVE